MQFGKIAALAALTMLLPGVSLSDLNVANAQQPSRPPPPPPPPPQGHHPQSPKYEDISVMTGHSHDDRTLATCPVGTMANIFGDCFPVPMIPPGYACPAGMTQTVSRATGAPGEYCASVSIGGFGGGFAICRPQGLFCYPVMPTMSGVTGTGVGGGACAPAPSQGTGAFGSLSSGGPIQAPPRAKVLIVPLTISAGPIGSLNGINLPPIPASGLGGYCRRGGDGSLNVRLQNWSQETKSPMQVTVEFGSVPSTTNVANSPVIPPNGTVDVSVPMPPACFSPTCYFTIRAMDPVGVTQASGSCVG